MKELKTENFKSNSIIMSVIIFYVFNIAAFYLLQYAIIKLKMVNLKEIYNMDIVYIISFIPFFIYYIIKSRKYKSKNKMKTMEIIRFVSYALMVGTLGVLISGLFKYIPHNLEIESSKLHLILGAIIIAPITEEILFRGILLKELEKYNYKLAILGTSLLFGIAHLNGRGMLGAFFIGVLLGYVAQNYSLKYCILLHMIYNGTVVFEELYMHTKFNTLISLVVFAIVLIGFVSIMSEKEHKIFEIYRLKKIDLMEWKIVSKILLLPIIIVLVTKFIYFYFLKKI